LPHLSQEGRAILRELRRRKVYQVAVAYVVVAWGLIDAASVIFPQLKLPDWSVTLVAALAIFGFPLALVLAWACALTPDGWIASTCGRCPQPRHRTKQPVTHPANHAPNPTAALPSLYKSETGLPYQSKPGLLRNNRPGLLRKEAGIATQE